MTDLEKQCSEIATQIAEQSIQIKELQAKQQELNNKNNLCDTLLLFLDSKDLLNEFDLFLEDLQESICENIDIH